LLALLVVAVPTAQANLVVGQLYDGYFTYGTDGYFHYGDAAYSRYWVSSPGYYQYGYYYPGYAYWKYTRIYTPSYSATPTVAAPAYGPNWKTEAVKVGAQLADMELYYKTLNALGFRGQNYSFQTGSFYFTGTPSLGSFGFNGTTNYGFGVANVTTQYKALDTNIIAAQAFKLGQGAQDNAREVTGQLLTITNEAVVGNQRVAETLAKGQAAAQLAERAARAVEAPPSSSSVTTTFGSGSSAGTSATTTPNAPVAGGDYGDVAAFQAQVLNTTCTGCHGGQEPKGKFNLTNWAKMSEEDHNRALERVVSMDPDKRMPRTADNKPGSISKVQLRGFVNFQ
jgi:hypothetical protein